MTRHTDSAAYATLVSANVANVKNNRHQRATVLEDNPVPSSDDIAAAAYLFPLFHPAAPKL